MRFAPVAVGLLLAAACGSDGDLPARVLAPSAGLERAEIPAGLDVRPLVAGLNEAGFDLWRTQPVEDNLVFSPSSIGHALLMARAAADESTGAAIDHAFGLPAGEASHEQWNAIAAQIETAQSDAVTVTVADRIWPRAGLAPDQEWIDTLARFHGADVLALDFGGDPDGSRATINEWVAEQTHDLIPELLPDGFVTERSVLVLTDALYFAADWQRPFGKYPAVDGLFSRLDGSQAPTSFMRELEGTGRRGPGAGFVAAELPYAGGAYSMFVVVPEDGRFAEIRERLGVDLLAELDALDTGPYELLLPTWDDHSDLDLLPWLAALGAAPGGYPGISPDAFIDGAVHGADIAVDEIGTVAAAATGVGFEESGPPEPALTVAADRPFLYLIRHLPSGLAVFAGQVTDPS